MRKKLMFLALCLSTAAIAGPYKAGQKLDAKKIGWMDRGMSLMRDKLKDPDSATFKDVYFSQKPGMPPAACGMVNAKNGFGAFTGYKYFFSAGKAEFTISQDDMVDFSDVWNQLCK